MADARPLDPLPLPRHLVQHKMVDCLVTTGGGIEEDFIKVSEGTGLQEGRGPVGPFP